MAYYGGANDARFYFMGDEFYNLVCDMLDLQDLIATTENFQRSTVEKENLDATFVHLGSRIEQDLSAIRVKLDQYFRRQPRLARWPSTRYTDVNNPEPLERGADGHVIHDLELIKRSREAKIGRSVDAQYGFRVGYQDGLITACLLWIVVSLAAPLFGVWESWVKWTIIVLGFGFMLRPRYVDDYPSLKQG